MDDWVRFGKEKIERETDPDKCRIRDAQSNRREPNKLEHGSHWRASTADGVKQIFQQQWWLSAASEGKHDEVVVRQADDVVARLAFVADRTLGFRRLRMPAFTHVLGPDVPQGKGKPQTELTRRLSLVRSLIDQLPQFDFFKVALDPSAAGGLANVDGLAFQEKGFRVSPQYNYRIDSSVGLERVWEGMNFRTRQHIRRAQESCCVDAVQDPAEFVDFYVRNLAIGDRNARFDLAHFVNIFAACEARKCGSALVARSSDGSPLAMTFLVWDDASLYYLLSARTPCGREGGATSLLIWSAIKKAHELGLCFDFDGVATSGIARFYAGFGGQICNRLIVIGKTSAFSAAQYFKAVISGADRESSKFT